MGERLDIRSMNFRDLQRVTEKEKGNIRFKNGEVYVSSARKPNIAKRLVDKLSGYTQAKRSAGATAVQLICNRYGLSFLAVMTAAGYTEQDVKDLQAGRRDLTDEQLKKALSRFVLIGDKVFTLEATIGKGGFGEVWVAAHGDERIALKTFIPPVGGDLSKLPIKRQRAAERFRTEVEVHRFATARTLDAGSNYVLNTMPVAEGPNGDLFQPMPLAYATAPDHMEQRFKEAKVAAGYTNRTGSPRVNPADVEPLPLTQGMLSSRQNDSLLVLRLRDQVDALRQIDAAGLAHRDVKSANYLLDQDGIWKLTDFGTSGAQNTLFQAAPGKANSLLTGNDNNYAKAPEWLRHEQRSSSARFQVGSECDVFAYGIMVFEGLTNGRRPFDGTQEVPSTWLGPTEYGESVLAYAQSGLSFSAWYQQHTGMTIPQKWQPLLDAALHADPAKRATAEQLRRFDVFQDPQLNHPKLRQDMKSTFTKKI